VLYVYSVLSDEKQDVVYYAVMLYLFNIMTWQCTKLNADPDSTETISDV